MEHVGIAVVDPYAIFKKIALAPGMRVADLGCGRTGHFVFPASRVVKNTGIVYAVEILKDILESIKSRARSEGYENVQAIWSDIERVGKTPIPPETLESCFMVNVLFMLNNKAGALEEAKRLIKSGGTIVVVDWAKKLGPLGPEVGKMVTLEELEQIAKKLSLKIADHCDAGDHHFCVIFQKE